MSALDDLRATIAAVRESQRVAFCAPGQHADLAQAARGLESLVRFVPADTVRPGEVLVYDRAEVEAITRRAAVTR